MTNRDLARELLDRPDDVVMVHALDPATKRYVAYAVDSVMVTRPGETWLRCYPIDPPPTETDR